MSYNEDFEAEGAIPRLIKILFLIGRVYAVPENKWYLASGWPYKLDLKNWRRNWFMCVCLYDCMHVCTSLYAHNKSPCNTHRLCCDSLGIERTGNTIGISSSLFRGKPSRVSRGSSARVAYFDYSLGAGVCVRTCSSCSNQYIYMTRHNHRTTATKQTAAARHFATEDKGGRTWLHSLTSLLSSRHEFIEPTVFGTLSSDEERRAGSGVRK